MRFKVSYSLQMQCKKNINTKLFGNFGIYNNNLTAKLDGILEISV